MRYLTLLLFAALALGLVVPASAQQETPDPAPENQPVVTQTAAIQPTAARWTAREIAFVAAPSLSFVAALIVVWFTRRNVLTEQRVRMNEAEARYIQEKLDKFYGPFIVESDANDLIARDLRARQLNPEKHRLLKRLFDPAWRAALLPGEAALVEEICQTGERLDNIIKEHSGLVDPDILPYIARAVTHFRVLKLAHDGKLGNDPDAFERYVYPRELDAVLEKEITRLRGRLKTLRDEPTKPHGEMDRLDLSKFELPGWPARPA